MTNCYNWSKQEARFLLNIPLDKNKGGQKSVGADLTKIAQKIGWNYHSTIVGMKEIYQDGLHGVRGFLHPHPL